MASASQSSTWEVSDAGGPPFRLNQNQIVDAILQRRFSLGAKGRSSPDRPWAPLITLKEFSPAFPDIRWDVTDAKIDEAYGIITVSSNPQTLLAASRRLKTTDGYSDLAFFMPLLTNRAGPPFTVSIVLFNLWEGVFAGVGVESRLVRPNMPLHGYVIAFNFSAKPQAHALITKGHPFPDDQKASLGFNLPTWCWAANPIFVPVKPYPGDYSIEFRSTSTAEKAGKAIAATALTLGMFTYVPGHKGFKMPFRVLSPQEMGTLDSFEASAIRAAESMFAASSVNHAAGRDGQVIPRHEFIARYRQFLRFNPDRAWVVMTKYKTPNEALRQMLERFTTQEFGGNVTIGATDGQKPSAP